MNKDSAGNFLCGVITCAKCKKEPAVKECTKTPNGGWGTLKCGAPLCKHCKKCGCDEVLVY